MYISNITNDYDHFTDTINDYNKTNNCTNNENINDIIIQTFLQTIPSGLSFLF